MGTNKSEDNVTAQFNIMKIGVEYVYYEVLQDLDALLSNHGVSDHNPTRRERTK